MVYTCITGTVSAVLADEPYGRTVQRPGNLGHFAQTGADYRRLCAIYEGNRGCAEKGVEKGKSEKAKGIKVR